MKLKMKLRKKFKFAATALLFMFGGHTKAHSQNTAHAGMKVSVRIVSNPQIDSNIITDISDQLTTGNELSLGDYTLDMPTGSGYTFSFDPEIKMKDKANSWEIKTDVQQTVDQMGKMTFNFSGKASTSSIPPGNYSGELSTTIEYI